MTTAGRAFTRRAGALTAVAARPGGTIIYTGADDGSVRQWDTASGFLLPRQLMQHEGPVADLVVTADGATLVSAGADGSIQIWDLLSERPAVPAIAAHSGPITALVQAPGGDHVLSCGFDGSIQFRDVSGGRLVGDPLSTYAGPVFDVAVTIDSRAVAVGVTGKLALWDLKTGRFAGESAQSHTGPSFAVAVTPDGMHAVSGGEDGCLRIWDIGLDCPRQDDVVNSLVVDDVNPPIRALAFTLDGTRVIIGRADGSITTMALWTSDRDSGQLIGHSDAIRGLTPTREGRAVSVSDDGTARVWDLTSSSAVVEPLTVLTAPLQPAVSRTETPSGGPPPPTPGFGTGLRDAGVATDSESAVDQLGVTDDVHTMAALLAAIGTTPPLSIALLGNWGAGKSTFMRLLQQRVADLARSARQHPGQTGFVGTIWQVRFNAWHYSDDHLWVGLVEHLFRELRQRPEHDTPARPDLTRRTELESELAAQKARHVKLERTLEQVDDLDPDRGWLGWLSQPLRTALVLRESGRSTLRQLRSARMLAGLVLTVAGVAVFVVAEQFGAMVIGSAAGILTVAAGLVTSAVTLWRRVRELTDAARQKLLAERRDRSAEIERLESELNRLDPARELDRLLSEITSTHRYEQFRGITGRIHYDLTRLSEALDAKAGADPGARTRIILYIDDLDRCVASRVVEVLQAVNLLLSMPLFNVVVAVDPRWLLRALDQHHGTLLNARVTGQTHSLDYLDKIFHVPFALPPMHRRGEGYLRLVLPTVEYRRPPEDPHPKAPAAAGPRGTPPFAPSPPPPPAPPGSRTADAPPPPVEVRTERLELSQQEWEFLPRLAPLVPTPRAAKKLSNLYRLVRGGLAGSDLESFISQSGSPYQAAAVLLAAVCSAPGDADALLHGLLTHDRTRHNDIESVFRSLSESAPVGAVLADFVRDLRYQGAPVVDDPAEYVKWSEHVARYSFATYHHYTASR